MCLKKLFGKPTPAVTGPVNKRALLFGDNYPGTSYQLSGCINDIDDVEAKLNKESPGYVISKFKNSEVTCARFYDEIKKALSFGRPGDFLLIWYSGHGTQIPSTHEADGYDEALYLHDGPFTDDQLIGLQQLTPAGMIVVAKFDSCFSGGMAKGFCQDSPHFLRNRFHQMHGIRLRTNVVRSFVKAESKWVIFSGSSEGQTSADAVFKGRANGAFTFFDLKCFAPGVSFANENKRLESYLPGNGFDQDPMLLGDSTLFNQVYV